MAPHSKTITYKRFLKYFRGNVSALTSNAVIPANSPPGYFLYVDQLADAFHISLPPDFLREYFRHFFAPTSHSAIVPTCR